MANIRDILVSLPPGTSIKSIAAEPAPLLLVLRLQDPLDRHDMDRIFDRLKAFHDANPGLPPFLTLGPGMSLEAVVDPRSVPRAGFLDALQPTPSEARAELGLPLIEEVIAKHRVPANLVGEPADHRSGVDIGPVNSPHGFLEASRLADAAFAGLRPLVARRNWTCPRCGSTHEAGKIITSRCCVDEYTPEPADPTHGPIGTIQRAISDELGRKLDEMMVGTEPDEPKVIPQE